MSLLFVDGFGYDDQTTKWNTGTVDNGSITTTSPRVPGGYNYNTSSFSVLHKSITASAQVFCGFGMSVGGNRIHFYGDSGATQHITVLRSGSTGLIEIRRGSESGTLLARGTTTVPSNNWYYLEISVTIDDAIGEVHVRLNGSTTDEVSYTGDTKNGGTATTIDAVRFDFTGRIADVYILNSLGALNNTFLGDVAVRTLIPSGNGTSSQLTGSDGNTTDNYLLVDEHSYSTTDYVGSPTTGQRDTYSISDLPAGVNNVYAVQTVGIMAKSDATAGSSKLALRSGGTVYYGTTRTLTTTYTGYYDLFETDPNTAAAWTVGNVNALESGMEVA